MTIEDIAQGFRKLGLADEKARASLARLGDFAPKPPAPSYETVTAANTGEVAGVRDAELEPGS